MRCIRTPSLRPGHRCYSTVAPPLRPELVALKGRTDIPRSDTITIAPLRARNSMFNNPAVPVLGDIAPVGWHLLYFRAYEQLSKELAGDGYESWHNPPAPFDHLMWGGARLRVYAPAKIGQTVHLQSEVENVSVKPSKQGELIFVNVKLTVKDDQKLLMTEHRDFIYRSSALPPSAESKEKTAGMTNLIFQKTFHPDPVMLFRFSALTWNSHRIHYDSDFSKREEGYSNTLVHGPLTFTCMAETLQEFVPNAAKRLQSFDYRAVAPLLNERPFTVCAQAAQEPHTLRMFALDSANRPAMLATIKLAPP